MMPEWIESMNPTTTFFLSIAMMATGLLLYVLLRRQSASLRHLVLALSMGGLLLIPIFTYVLPALNVAIPVTESVPPLREARVVTAPPTTTAKSAPTHRPPSMQTEAIPATTTPTPQPNRIPETQSTPFPTIAAHTVAILTTGITLAALVAAIQPTLTARAQESDGLAPITGKKLEAKAKPSDKALKNAMC